MRGTEAVGREDGGRELNAGGRRDAGKAPGASGRRDVGGRPDPRENRDVDPLDARTARTFRRAVGPLIALGIRAVARVETSGVRADLGGTPLIVINHRSFLDPLVVVTLCRARGVWPYTFAREDFFDRPPHRTVMRLLRAIPALRGRSALDGLRRAERLLDSEQVVVIAAEGRIVPYDERPDGVGELRGGAAWLAHRTSELVVLTLTGTDEVWPVTRRLPRWSLRRPTVTVRARRITVAPGVRGRVLTDTIRTTMSELIDGG